MKNNIIKDDREISMKAEIYTDINNEPDSIKFTNNSPIELHEMNTETLTEPHEMNTETLTDMSNPTEPMMMPNEPMIEPAHARSLDVREEECR